MGWGDKFNQLTQTAVSKSKELAEVTKLNLEISNTEKKMQEIYIEIGKYMMENDLLKENPFFEEKKAALLELKAVIDENREKIQIVKNINICPNCGAEVPRTAKFCNSCGTQMINEPEQTEEEGKICPNCGEKVEEDSAFCGNCGTKLE